MLEYVRARFDQSCCDRSLEVLKLIDTFGTSENYLMNVGEQKGSIVRELIARYKPKTMVEFGSYVGYSTVLFATAVRDNGGSEYLSFERESKFEKVASAMVELAELTNIVRFISGPSSSNLVKEHKEGRLGQVDMIFLDHYKPSYVKDLKILESLGVIKEGTVLVADNVIYPGNPSYLSYVRSSPAEKLVMLNQQSRNLSAFPATTVKQYKEYDTDNIELSGNPGIEYESRLVHSQEPTGIPDGLEITICKVVPNQIL